uniref:microsomal glutathione S-transferase 2 n=1 Tax=Myodes glareolus TaxID=447135 RepID=UPI0020208698|nr:microsomal glutathione S-transferase 2 [Myodes glareolus]
MAGDSVLLAVVSLLSVCQQTYFAISVGQARHKYKISPPAVSGSPEFERIFRAQQNSLESYPVFILVLWLAGLYFNQVLASCLGLVYLYARHKYFWGYAEAADKRITGFKLSLGSSGLLVLLAALGVANRFLDEYLDFHVTKKLRHSS